MSLNSRLSYSLQHIRYFYFSPNKIQDNYVHIYYDSGMNTFNFENVSLGVTWGTAARICWHHFYILCSVIPGIHRNATLSPHRHVDFTRWMPCKLVLLGCGKLWNNDNDFILDMEKNSTDIHKMLEQGLWKGDNG